MTLRLIIVIASLGYIYWKLVGNGSFPDLWNSVITFSGSQFFPGSMIVVFLLMILNWSVEALKWKLLVSRVTGLSWIRALQSVVTGVTISIFTPNRTGEFIGRAFILKTVDPAKAVLLTIVGSLSQLLITILAGGTAVCLILRDIVPHGTVILSWMYAGCVSGLLLLNLILVLLFFRMPLLMNLTKGRFAARFPKLMDYLKVVAEIHRLELLKVTMLSLLRYIVFSIQFYIVLRAFGVSLPVFEGLLIIAIIFLALAVIPTFALSELGVRGSVSLYFIGTYMLNTTGREPGEREAMAIVLAAGLLWVVNLALPAIIGIPFVFKLRFFRK